ncbi:uncharacterized protein BDR25DRAFT_293216 [Lindgomyces ingoldianus]|uniref:Uncharacterized protein n=1 Tax=Lindgomyces ingoldianus TaxID=673940 RepID=A0ACB6QIR7_9PLEO|nr:uncharacterized protein BDR25DRAFT_293216 [Lindgomyces ingoldianus]KAF2466785.1 hypothetical protein BDR25DRAFT_293216 [Lindgomyces ingoldianus]
MATTDRMDQPAEVATKVLRRAQVSKMTRTLQNRLALANVKIKHGWESLSLDTLEPRVDVELKRKRPGSSNETLSETSSVSERFYQPGVLDSSPLAAPIFSDDVQRSGSRSGSSHSQSKRPRYGQAFNRYPGSSNHTRKTRASNANATSWKTSYQLAESSPVYPRKHPRFGNTHAPTLSFVSETSTVPDDLRSPLSEDDDDDLPISSFQINSSHMRSSPPRPPRTPPPAVARSARLRQNGFAVAAARDGQKGEEDANLLMYLATSPSPAHPGSSKPRMLAPSTPPPKSTPLPSSMMSTPGGGGAPFPGFGLNTPSANLNFAEFLNMTPSPAQVGGSWTRTPAAGKTPAAAREARRRLNFDNLHPPTGDSPRIGMDRSRIGKVEGLGMDLGGELVS